jgi:hypothetical protein
MVGAESRLRVTQCFYSRSLGRKAGGGEGHSLDTRLGLDSSIGYRHAGFYRPLDRPDRMADARIPSAEAAAPSR